MSHHDDYDDETPSGGAGLSMLSVLWAVVIVLLLVLTAGSWWEF